MTFRPRIRTIKPEMWADEKIGQLSRDARLLFVGLITMADDEGRLRALPAAIIGHAYPYDADVTAAKISKWMAELHASGLVVAYDVAGRPYALLTGWKKHQRINRANESELPPAPGREASTQDHGAFSDGSVKAHDAITDDARPRAQARVIADQYRDQEQDQKSVRGARANEPSEQTAAVAAVLAQCPRLHVDRIGVENAIAAWPNGDPLQAAHEVVTWATDPAFQMTNAARALGSALSKQQQRQQQRPRTYDAKPDPWSTENILAAGAALAQEQQP